MRVISLCPSLTELVFMLDRGDDLIGITKYCVHPVDQVAAIEKLGGTKDPDVARMIDLKPDLVLLNQEENRREDHDALTAAGVRCWVTFPKNVAESTDMVLELGNLLDRRPHAEEIASEISKARERARRFRETHPPVSWAYLIWRKPWMSVNGDTYISALLTEGGGRNVFADRADWYPSLTVEELRDADPNMVFLSSEPFPFKEKHIVELAEKTGLEQGRFILVDGESCSWHGSRSAEGLNGIVDIYECALSNGMKS